MITKYICTRYDTNLRVLMVELKDFIKKKSYLQLCIVYSKLSIWDKNIHSGTLINKYVLYSICIKLVTYSWITNVSFSHGWCIFLKVNFSSEDTYHFLFRFLGPYMTFGLHPNYCSFLMLILIETIKGNISDFGCVHLLIALSKGI